LDGLDLWLVDDQRDDADIDQRYAQDSAGLGNFYLAGQWVEPGGSVPLAAASGKNAIQLVCAADDQEFVPSLP